MLETAGELLLEAVEEATAAATAPKPRLIQSEASSPVICFLQHVNGKTTPPVTYAVTAVLIVFAQYVMQLKNPVCRVKTGYTYP